LGRIFFELEVRFTKSKTGSTKYELSTLEPPLGVGELAQSTFNSDLRIFALDLNPMFLVLELQIPWIVGRDCKSRPAPDTHFGAVWPSASLQLKLSDFAGFHDMVFALEELKTRLPLAKGAGGIICFKT
jgi:hypothetical protein